MSHVLHRDLLNPLPTAVAGEGHYLIDKEGRRYLDACGGAAVSCLGHSEKRVQDAICAQLSKINFAHTGFFTNDPAELLAERLIRAAPTGMGDGRVMFLGSGSEAMEASLKLVRQYHLERGDTSRTHIIARNRSYHGNTLGALAVSGHAGRRAPYGPILADCNFIDPCYAYRYQHIDERDVAFGRRMANQLATKIDELGAENVAAFVAEPVVGATLGSQPAAVGYFSRIRETCDANGVLFVADEVMCGSGRTGTLFALEAEDTHADIVTLAKGIGAGFQPISAVVASQSVCDVIATGSGQLWNGHTYMSHAVVCAGALAVLDVIETEGLLDNVCQMGAVLEKALHDQFGDHPNIGSIRGRGLFWSFEIVQDRATKMPFSAEQRVAPRFKAAAMAHRMLSYPQQGCADGTNGDHVLLAPPYTITSEEIGLIVERTAEALSDTLVAVA